MDTSPLRATDMDVPTNNTDAVTGEFIDTEAVAALCDVKPGTVASWRSSARSQPLPFYKLGGRRLYRKTDVIAFITSRRVLP